MSSDGAEGQPCKTKEKLWNGTLQLSSSAQLPAAAYFRSGDKMPDIYWSDSVEVKGKVRLEAFEKYIQDLPRSRTRGLMVMSLCLREGSSKDLLKAMNEAIKKYEIGKRVGRAQLSPGVDIYICPNNEAIITILAKNGFSNGSISVEDQDSLIGCAVWRKNSSTDIVSKKLGNQLLPVTEIDSSSVKADATQHTSAETPATNGVIQNSFGETKNEESSSDVHTINSIVKKLTDIEASIFRSLGIEKHEGNLQLLRTILPSSSEIVKQPDPETEDDDLPEYDFGPSDAIPVKIDVAPSQIHVEAQKDVVYGGSLQQKRKIRSLFDEDDMPEWQPPEIKQFKAEATNQITRPPFVPDNFRPLPPAPPPQPPSFGPSGRPQQKAYNIHQPINHNRWSRN